MFFSTIALTLTPLMAFAPETVQAMTVQVYSNPISVLPHRFPSSSQFRFPFYLLGVLINNFIISYNIITINMFAITIAAALRITFSERRCTFNLMAEANIKFIMTNVRIRAHGTSNMPIDMANANHWLLI
jgi:hypothetical protein